MAKQGGLLGHVTVPRTYKAPGSHKVELAYITKKEANKLKELDLHNSGIGKEMHYGPEGIPNYNGGGGGFGGGFDGGGGGRAEVGKDDAREAARIVAAIASANKAAPGALERLGAQRVSAAQSGPRGALGRTPTKRATPVRAPVSRPAPVVESAGTVAPINLPNQPTTNMNIIERILSPNFNKAAHKQQSQTYENLAKKGSITGAYADKLKGWDLQRQGFNPMLGLMGAVPYQVLTNTYDQYDPNSPYWGIPSAWGGITSGLGQGWSNMQGIVAGLLGYRPSPDI